MVTDVDFSVEALKLRFYRIYASAQKPMLADDSAHGLLPLRAYRYCEAARVASSIGWYVFPPVDFSVLYDGADVFWRFDDSEDWKSLDDVVLLDEAEAFDAACPEALRGHCPPFLGGGEEGLLQVATGLALRTNPGWGVLIRRPPNVPQRNHILFWEGFVESSKWFGPLFINLKPLSTDIEVRFSKNWPVAFVQPVPTALMKTKLAGKESYVGSFDEFDEDDWSSLEDTLTNRLGPDRQVAKYARRVRKKSD